MNTPLPALERPPEARAETVEDLVLYTRRGRVRVPTFQRGIKWETEQVLDLFDSIYRGLPVGALLLFKRDAPAAAIKVGPLHIDAPEIPQAWWVVDGQQRLTSLTASLARTLPLPRTPVDPFIVYFDPSEGIFRSPPASGDIPSIWVPLPLLLDAARLGEWILEEWPHKTDRDLVRKVFEAGKRIRDYRLPLYIVETDNSAVLRDIFFRVNNTGKRLEWNEVHDALYGTEGPSPSTSVQLADELAKMGMGRLDESELTSCLLALRGLDVTRTLAEHRRKDPDVLRGAVAEALPVLRQVLSFLRTHGTVPHLRLLPRSLVLEVLTRFFFLHPEPSARSMELLTRWTWRALLGERAYDERTLRRRGVAAINDDEERSVQALLALLPRERQPVTFPETFDARAAGSRLALLALASLGPRNLSDGQPVDVAAMIEKDGADAFRLVVPVRPGALLLARSPANRTLHPGTGSLRRLLIERINSAGPEDVALASHAVSPAAARALSSGESAGFFEMRKQAMIEALERLGERLAGWSRHDHDRPSIAYLLRQAGDST
jgi:hypothetical protein